jgi:penicillin-binding protein 1A
MREAGFIDDLQLQSASASPLLLKPAEPKFWTSRAPYFTSWVAQELPKVLSPEDLEVGGLTIRTSLNMSWQERAQATINKHAPGEMEGAVVSMEPGTGLVRSMVGGKDFDKSQFNRAAQALRSPGSTFKLFVYLTALKEGMKPEDAINDRQVCCGLLPEELRQPLHGHRAALGGAAELAQHRGGEPAEAVGIRQGGRHRQEPGHHP